MLNWSMRKQGKNEKNERKERGKNVKNMRRWQDRRLLSEMRAEGLI